MSQSGDRNPPTPELSSGGGVTAAQSADPRCQGAGGLGEAATTGRLACPVGWPGECSRRNTRQQHRGRQPRPGATHEGQRLTQLMV